MTTTVASPSFDDIFETIDQLTFGEFCALWKAMIVKFELKTSKVELVTVFRSAKQS